MAMRRNSRTWVIVLSLIAGAIVGTALWQVLSGILPSALAGSLAVGTTGGPLTVDLYLLQLSFGIILRFNIGTAIGVLVAAILVRR